ncbi:deacylase-like protein [Syntrophomonas wolfei subsp. wolfei str. Goettingen G311]|uniref:Deacylase-like protein n=1 Tax=Syntrophomonas wolfei subsp. wolfei (strain DSM 2245B / Goettingen) TaxID=335541 RepID=Q0AXR9_SYNWW|nr:deacylase-like protein [Syntrophomonas wolfei subsp. wolfei str. Goettingen G311]
MKKVRHHRLFYSVSLSLAVLTLFLFWGNSNSGKAFTANPPPGKQLAVLSPSFSLPSMNTYWSQLTNTYSTKTNSLVTPAKKPLPTDATPTGASLEKKQLAVGTRDATDLYIIRSGKAGPVVMIVGGVHGNETAGYRAARIVRNYQISRGTLLVLPEANSRAVNQGVRYVSGQKDLNRCFPTSSSGAADTRLSREIYYTLKKYNVDWLMDMHEGYNYSRLNSSSSVGQSLIYYPSSSTREVASKIVNNMNSGISTSYRKFSLLRYPTRGSLSRAAGQYLGVKSFIFETCSRDSLSTRLNYQLRAADILLGSLGMK